MEFIMENYIWFIIGGIVILMTIIGYIADKTNFTKREENKEKVKHSKKNKVEIKDEMVEEEQVQETHEINPIEDFSMDDVEPAFVTDELETVEENLNNDDVEEVQKLENIEDLVQNEEMNDITNEEVADETFEQPIEDTVEPIEEDLYVGLDGTPNVYKETEEQDENLEIELPSISSLDSELKEETDEDDVWKF